MLSLIFLSVYYITEKQMKMNNILFSRLGGIGMKYGFEIQEILLVPHGGWHNDTIVVVERKRRIDYVL